MIYQDSVRYSYLLAYNFVGIPLRNSPLVIFDSPGNSIHGEMKGRVYQANYRVIMLIMGIIILFPSFFDFLNILSFNTIPDKR